MLLMQPNTYQHRSAPEGNPVSSAQPLVFNAQTVMNLVALSVCDVEKGNTFI